MTETTLPLTPEQIEQHARILEVEVDRATLANSAMTLASAGQTEAAATLSCFLTAPDFWARLDVLDDPDLKLANLASVLTALARHPTDVNEPLALTLLANESFLADSDRATFVLPMLAAVRPMSETVATLFRKTNNEGYRSSNGPLLVANGSPRALTIFGEMLADPTVPEENRIDMIHWALPAHRAAPGVLETLAPFLEERLEPDVERALLETFFDYQGDDWFGVARFAPVPPPWSAVDTDVLRTYLDVGYRLTQRPRLPDELRTTIESTLNEIRKELASRWA